ncbi:DUF4435 domain-containing protein [Desulfovibrio piger]
MTFTYYLPDANNAPEPHETEKNAIIIIGANGSGKSHLGAWMEMHDKEDRIHRIGGQRNLSFNAKIHLKSYSEATDIIIYGLPDVKEKRFKWDQKKYTTKLIDDFESVLAALIALNSKEESAFFKSCKAADQEGSDHPDTPETVLDKFTRVWDAIFPQRRLLLDDAKFYAVFQKEEAEERYSATEMSDGERSVLYLAAQVLSIPKNKIFIIDEPELHLHGSIMNKLWQELEKERPDCLFIYITHDMNFAAMHGDVHKIWIKSYDGHSWQYEKLPDTDLPEELRLSILGGRKPVIFVEGEKQSFDTQLYSILYPQYHVIACGSCTQVIALTKAFNKETSLHDLAVYGIIDRDFRTDREIEQYKKDNIFTLDVAEVENLFLIEDVIRYIAKYLHKNPDEIFSSIEKNVRERLSKQINSQICKSIAADIKYQLSTAAISHKSEEEVQQDLERLVTNLSYADTKQAHEEKFTSALNKSYAMVIKVFNEKGLAKSMGHHFGLNDKAYCEFVINELKNNKNSELVNAFLEYLPSEIERTI